MKGMIYKDGKFISILTETATETLYADLPRHKKQKETRSAKKTKTTKSKKLQ